MSPVNLDTAIFNPASVFNKPEEILNDVKITLTREQKIRALQTWQYDIQLRLAAEAENMHSNQDETDIKLEDEIIFALHLLQDARGQI